MFNYNQMWAFLKKLCAEMCGEEINIRTFVADSEQAGNDQTSFKSFLIPFFARCHKINCKERCHYC